ncbi:TPA: hypothetical protein ACNBBG_002593, partial [Legionella pneumophila]
MVNALVEKFNLCAQVSLSLLNIVIAIDDQLPKFKDAPKEQFGSGELKFFSQKKKLEENQPYMRVDEYLKLDEVQKRFPGAGKKLDGGLPG